LSCHLLFHISFFFFLFLSAYFYCFSTFSSSFFTLYFSSLFSFLCFLFIVFSFFLDLLSPFFKVLIRFVKAPFYFFLFSSSTLLPQSSSSFPFPALYFAQSYGLKSLILCWNLNVVSMLRFTPVPILTFWHRSFTFNSNKSPT